MNSIIIRLDDIKDGMIRDAMSNILEDQGFNEEADIVLFILKGQVTGHVSGSKN
jgi:hypothetical protein